MAWTTPRTWVTGEVVTAALLNAQIKANMDLSAPAKLTSAGDMLYATGSNATARLPKGTNGNILHQASCAPAWTATPSITDLTLSGALDVNGTIDYDGTDVDMLSSGDIDLVSSANAAAAVYIAQSTGTSGTIKIHADTGTSVTEGAESINILSDAGGVGIRSTANLANAINITNDGGTTGTISIFNDQGSSVTEGAESISLLSDAGGVGIRSTANLANAVNITADGGTTSTIQIFNDQGTAVNEGVASIQLLSDVGGIGIKSGLNAAGAIRLTADAGTSETIMIHADQGSGTGSICLTSDAGGITLNPATFVTVGANATNAAEVRMFEDTDNGCNYVALKAPNVSTSYTITLPPAVAGTCGFVLTSTTAGVTSWAAAAGGIASLAADTSPQVGGSAGLDLQAQLLVGNGGSTGIAITSAGEVSMAAQPSFLANLTSQATNAVGNGGGASIWYSTDGTDAWTAIFDQNADFDDDGTFKAPITGRYLIGAFINVQGITSGMTYSEVRLVTSNRSYYPYVGQAGDVATSVGDNLSMGGSAIADMDACDVFTITTQFHGGAKVADINATTMMWAQLVA